MVSYSRSRVSRAQVARLAQLDHFLERAEQDKKSLAATMTNIGEPIISELREEGSAFEHRIKKLSATPSSRRASCWLMRGSSNRSWWKEK
jgi:hypothetical protein